MGSTSVTTIDQVGPVDQSTGEVLEDGVDIQAVADQLIRDARGQSIELTGTGGLLTGLVRQVRQSALEAELTEHLGHEHGDGAGKAGANVRNGSTPKTVRTEIGEVTIQVPRDRAGTFTPTAVPKHQRRMRGSMRRSSRYMPRA